MFEEVSCDTSDEETDEDNVRSGGSSATITASEGSEDESDSGGTSGTISEDESDDSRSSGTITGTPLLTNV